MKTVLSYVVLASVLFVSPAAAQTFNVSQPAAGTTNIKSAEDFPTRAFQDPWDMSQRTDVGWWTFGTDTAIGGNYQSPTVANGIFSGTMSGSTATLFLLESGLLGPNAAPVGKTGQQFPIDANKYTHLVYRMNSNQSGVSQYVWSRNTIYEGQTVAVENAQSSTVVQTGWKFYDVNLPSLTPAAGSGQLIP